jgi:predicted nucleic acid-binding protein
MNLSEVLRGASIFLDANIFIYAVERRSPQCRQLLERCDGEGVRAFSSAVVLAEVCHRRMINEAKEAGLVSGANPARLLGRSSGGVQGLSIYAQNTRDLLDSPIIFEPILTKDFYVALELQKQHGLLTNDSLNFAVARRLGLQALATADQSFDNVPGLIVYKPEDIFQ